MNETIRELRELAAEVHQCADEAQTTTNSRFTPTVVALMLYGFAVRLDEIAERAEARQASETEPQANWKPSRLATWLWS